jgi:hypothetical protein
MLAVSNYQKYVARTRGTGFSANHLRRKRDARSTDGDLLSVLISLLDPPDSEARAQLSIPTRVALGSTSRRLLQLQGVRDMQGMAISVARDSADLGSAGHR